VVDSRGATTYEYDARDRLKQYNQPIFYSGLNTTAYGRVGYEYDAAGNRTMVKYMGQQGVVREQTAYEYDKAHRLRACQTGCRLVMITLPTSLTV
jgi:hypothetical protein